MRLRVFSLSELEAGLLAPHTSDLMNLLLSRWLIRDPKVRPAAGAASESTLAGFYSLTRLSRLPRLTPARSAPA